jgi:ATP-binding cassette, subfamily C, bacterial CydD
VSRQIPADRPPGRHLNALHRYGGWPGKASLLLPLLSGALLVPQAALLAFVLHRAIVEHAALASLYAPIVALLGLLLLRALLGAVGETLAAHASEAIKLLLRRALFADMLGRAPSWTAAQSSGGLSTLMIEQVDALDGFFTRYLPASVQAALLPLAFAVTVLPFDWVVASIFLITAPLIPVFMMLAGWGAESASRAQAGALARLTGRFADRLRGITTLKLFGRDAAETEAMYAASEELRRRSMNVMRIAFLSSAVLEFFAALGVAGVALYCGLSLLGLIHLRTAPLSLETALFCLLLAPEVYLPLRLLATHYHDRAAAKSALAEMVARLGALPPLEAPVIAHPVAAVHIIRPAAGVSLRLRDFGVATPSGAAVLSDVDLDIAAGEHIAIMGESGAGKSTLLEALARLRPSTGSIELDGAPLTAIDEHRLRADIGFLGQRPRLVAGSIADNIRLGRLDACRTAVIAAARQALVGTFTDTLPQGLDTRIGEDGFGLSGGEAQRVALARLYLRAPRVILLDEPTAHLDTETEAAMLDNLLAFARRRTLVVVTHSRRVADRMDRAYVLAGGQLLPTLRTGRRRASAARDAA